MKTFLIILTFIVSSHCGLLKDLLPEGQSQGIKDLLNQKPKSAPESNKTEYHQGVLIKVVETLENGTKIVIDALGNIIHINPNKNNGEVPKTGSNLASTTETPIKDTDAIKKDEASKLTDPKTDKATNTSTEEVKVASKNFTTEQKQTALKIDDETPKLDENKKNTQPTEANKEIKDTTANVTSADGKNGSQNSGNNCTTTDTNPCGNVTVVTNRRTFFKGNECPKGKNRADDGNCVEEV